MAQTIALAAALSGCNDPRGKNAPAERPQSTSLESTIPTSVGPASAATPAPSAAPRNTSAAPARPRDPLNVILIIIDGLRADQPWAGYEREVAPWLTRFAKRAVDYTRAYAISSTTARSIAPLLASKYPSEMPRTGHYFTSWHRSNTFVSEILRERDHRTLAAHAHAYFYGENGINQGFSDYQVLPGTKFNNTSPTNITSERMTALAQQMLSHPSLLAKDAPTFFAYFHYMDPHNPYLAHDGRPSFGDEPRDRYDQEVHYTDEWVGKLIDWARRQQWGARTAFVVTADHGECFGEHGQLKHGYELWEELIHVPLLIWLPGVEHRRIEEPRSHIDLAPTILELAGVDVPPRMRGKSLVAELFGAAAETRPVIADLPRDALQDRRRALIRGRYKLTALGDDERFRFVDLAEDPGERRDASVRSRAAFTHMKKLYFELSEQIPNQEVRGDVPLKGAPEGRRW